MDLLPSPLWGGAGGGDQKRGARKRVICFNPHQALSRQPPHRGEAEQLLQFRPKVAISRDLPREKGRWTR